MPDGLALDVHTGEPCRNSTIHPVPSVAQGGAILNVSASPGVPDIVKSKVLDVGELARIAGQRGIAGRQCELSHDVLIGDAQTNLPK